MEPEDSLLYSQEPTTDSYPEPDASNPYFSALFLYDAFCIQNVRRKNCKEDTTRKT